MDMPRHAAWPRFGAIEWAASPITTIRPADSRHVHKSQHTRQDG